MSFTHASEPQNTFSLTGLNEDATCDSALSLESTLHDNYTSETFLSLAKKPRTTDEDDDLEDDVPEDEEDDDEDDLEEDEDLDDEDDDEDEDEEDEEEDSVDEDDDEDDLDDDDDDEDEELEDEDTAVIKSRLGEAVKTARKN